MRLGIKAKIFIKASLILIVLFTTAISIAIYYLQYILHFYADPQYDFVVEDQSGWYSVQKPAGIYYGIGTADGINQKSISTLVINPTVHDPKYNYNDFARSCTKHERDASVSALTKTVVYMNNLQGVVCISEGFEKNVDKTYIYRHYFLQKTTPSKYDYL